MISASKALSSIEQAILGVRRDEDRLTKMLASAAEDAARLRAEQAEAYKALARLKLDALARDEVVGRLDTAERAAVAALEQRKAALAEIAAERERLVTATEEADRKRDAAAERLEAAIDAAEDLAEKTRVRLAGDGDWLAASERVKTAAATAAAAAEKASQSEADRDEKRKPYDADPLFTYLWKRGYGTSAYRAGPLVRFFDGKVARLIRFEEARPNFYMLNEIPLRLREHAERLAEAVETAQADLEALERRALVADGITEREAAVAAATEAHEAADEAAEDLEKKLAAVDERQAALLDGSKDPGLGRAVDGLAAAIAREDLAALYREALATPTPEDETIVARLREIEPRLARREAEAEEVRKTAVELAKKRTELEQSRDEFHRSGYRQPGGEFADGAIIGSIITGILRGALSSKNLNDALGSGFRIGRSSSRRSGGFGGGFKMPSRPSRPSRSSGGFHTGGRF